MYPTTLEPAPIARDDVIGIDVSVPILGGAPLPFVNLDNAASTPPLRQVAAAVEEFLPFYAGVHRGTGYKSRVSTEVFEQSRGAVGRFVGADPCRDVVIFTKNTTEAVNRLAHSMELPSGAVILTTQLEHHSNDLPWRGRAHTEPIGLLADGRLDLDDLDRLLQVHGGRVALVAISGASNVTGVVQPVHQIAERVHACGGRILVDAAQLAAHRRIDMRPHGDPAHLDFVVLSAHKMYAPYGTGALVAPLAAFGEVPDHSGGGTVHAVTPHTVAWAGLPDREEAGSPNVVGALALATAVRVLSAADLDAIAAHEHDLLLYAVTQLSTIPGLGIHGPDSASPDVDKVGVIPLTLAGIDHGLVAAVLSYEHGVGVRSGCFCAHSYIAHLLGLDTASAASWAEQASTGDKRGAPGMVRLSIGCYNDYGDIDRVVDGLGRVVAGDIAGHYDAELDGSYRPRGYVEPMLFSWGDS